MRTWCSTRNGPRSRTPPSNCSKPSASGSLFPEPRPEKRSCGPQAALPQSAMSWEQEVTLQLGQAGIRELAAEFYRRIRTDDLIGPMYPQDDWEGSERRLADFLCF